ncbi:MAG TPA: MarR family transcriptional regulator, partial [Cytophagales bacterium]|nr:MarR family transcriptional regulator [Cytophagales bacterium]
MSKSIFNPKHQQIDISTKIVAGLERISEAFKVLL